MAGLSLEPIPLMTRARQFTEKSSGPIVWVEGVESFLSGGGVGCCADTNPQVKTIAAAASHGATLNRIHISLWLRNSSHEPEA